MANVEIKGGITTSNQIRAIKLVCDFGGLGLKAAKDLIDKVRDGKAVSVEMRDAGGFRTQAAKLCIRCEVK
ncbi:MAG: hypothetical protein AAF740_05130 [Bacteroidota bacterium]